MILFQVIIYSLFGILFIYFIYTGIKKVNEIKASQSQNESNSSADKNPSSFSELYSDVKENEAATKALLDKSNGDENDFDKAYLKRLENGEKAQQFLALGNRRYCLMIRSILFDEGIPTYMENQHINSIYGISNSLSSYSPFSMKLYILVNDYDRAYKIVADFRDSLAKKSDSEENKIEDTIKTVTTAAVTDAFFTPLPEGVSEKMGIAILPKCIERD